MRVIGWVVALCFSAAACAAGDPSETSALVERYVRPYVETNNFSGVVLAARHDKPVFAKAYGFADRDSHTPNTLTTRFHVASMSMQFTAAAALRLVMTGKLSLDTPVSDVVKDFPNGSRITVRHLLTQTSGIRDINHLTDYDQVLKAHQTPASLVEHVRKLAPEREPGTFEGEEHSAYNLLALIIERRSGRPFAEAVEQLVFKPLRMEDSGIDDDGVTARRHAAKGYAPEGATGLVAADRIHWSAKAGNGSAYTTAADELRFVQGLFDDGFLSPKLRAELFDPSVRVGYGWFKAVSKRFGEPVDSMNGRAPGFASAVVYVPSQRVFVVALSNIYASFTPDIASDVTAIMLGRPYQPLALKPTTDRASLSGLPARFQFPADFYQPNAVITVESRQREVSVRWPTGDLSPLVSTGTDHYVDRAYGVPVEMVRDATGQPLSLKYDRFTGKRVDETTK